MQITVEWQSKIRFYTKSVSQKLREIGDDFGFEIEQNVLNDHEDLAALRWQLQELLGKNNYCATRALTKLYFAYINHGQTLLRDEILISQLFADLVAKFGSVSKSVAASNSQTPRGEIVAMDGETVNSLMNKYHFLGYGRSDSYHLGMRCEGTASSPLAAATFSPWDLDHATPILQRFGIKPSAVLVLSRLLSVPGTGRLTLSQFIAQLNHWVRKEMRQIKMIATYCNPNAGHYGTVYRGAKFLPLCTETHACIPFLDNEYVSPRKCSELCHLYGAEKCRSILRPSQVKPLPLLIYYYPVRMSSAERRQMVVGHCVQPYPVDLDACLAVA